MTQNLEESVKIVKNALEAGGVYPDTVSRNNDGHIIVRDGFFYKSGRTSEGHAHKIKKALDAAGIKHSIVDNGEHNAPFRGGASVAKSCHFYTHVKLHEDALEEGNVPSHLYHKPRYVANPSAMAGDHHTTPEQRRADKAKRLKAKASVNENAEINEVSKDLLKRYVAKGDRSYDNLLDKTLDSWKSAEDNEDRPAERRKHQANAVRLGQKADRRALSLNKADARLTEEMGPQEAHFRKHRFYSHLLKTPTKEEAVQHALNKINDAFGKKSVKEEILGEAYPSAAAMSRKAKAVKQARAVANGYANQKSGKWSSQSYKTEDGRWASKDVKEETLVERYKRATGRATLREASAGTLVSTKGSDKASRYEMHTNMPGEASEYSSIIKTHQDGKPLQNQWGGYNTLRTGKTAYVKKHFDKLDEEVLDEGAQTRSGAFAFTHTPGDTDSEEKLTKLKKMVKAHNTAVDEHSKLRVTARGRLGKDNPEAAKYRKGGEVWNAKSRPAGTYDDNHNWTPKADGSRKRGDMRDLPMKDAKHHDIYVHPAPQGWDKPGFQERYAKDPYNKISTNHAKSLISAHKAICEEAGLMEARPDFYYQEWPGQKPKKAFNLSKYLENNAKRQAALKKKAVAEDVEQIDELSKATLGSYVKKASNDVASKAVEYGTKKAERDEVDRITNRHMKYADKDTVHQALKTTSDDVEAPRVKAAKRIGGIAKAVGKLTNEEALTEAPYYSLEASKARMAKEKARATAKAAIAAAKKDSSIARKEARENRSLHIARHIEAEVGNHYPDSDGFEAISNKVRKMGIPHHEVIDHLDKAARKHLGAKSFDHYVDNFHKDAQGSN